MDNEQIKAEIRALKSLLANTDYNSNKLIEDLVLTMQSATVTNFITKFISWLKSAITNYGDLVSKRASWREKIEELESILGGDVDG